MFYDFTAFAYSDADIFQEGEVEEIMAVEDTKNRYDSGWEGCK